jgi:hypothetical protein
VSDTNVFNVLRLRYKVAFDSYRAISTRNAELLRNGGELSEQARADEDRAAAALKEARDELMAATARIGN